MSEKYTVEVQQVDESFIEIPPELLEQLSWKEGDDIKFDVKKDCSIHLKKVNLESVKLDFDDDELLRIMVAAHDSGLSFNEFCHQAVESFIIKEEFNNECG